MTYFLAAVQTIELQKGQSSKTPIGNKPKSQQGRTQLITN